MENRMEDMDGSWMKLDGSNSGKVM
jgi:hypothetical protein